MCVCVVCLCMCVCVCVCVCVWGVFVCVCVCVCVVCIHMCLCTVVFTRNRIKAALSHFLVQTLTLDFAEDIAMFEEEGYLFLAVITSNSPRGCEVINLLPSNAAPARSLDFEYEVSEFLQIVIECYLSEVFNPFVYSLLCLKYFV